MIFSANKTKIALGLTILTAISGFTLNALAHKGATGVVKERMDLMSNIGKAQKSLAAMFSGKETYDATKVQQAARIIETHAGDRIPKLFPKGTIGKPSEALPAIWDNWQEFEKISHELAVYAKALHDNAGNSRNETEKKSTGMMGSSMMGSSMMGGSSGGMMTMGNNKENMAAVVKMLKEMPPMASFQRVAQTCTACHSKFRMKKK